MKWILSFLLLISVTMRSQDVIFGNWYHIGTERLLEMSISSNTISWNDKTFQFRDREEKKDVATILTMFSKSDITGIVHKSKDTSDIFPYSLTVFKQVKGSRFLDLMMECSDGSYEDTTNVYNHFAACNAPDKMIMRFYSKSSIDSFNTLPPAASITRTELVRINASFKKKKDLLITKFGEKKLLWVAPVIFQQVLTNILLQNGYNPMITQEQAEKLFDFNFF